VTKLPLCFILMPFGMKANTDGSMINFDRVYQDLIAPAIRDAELEPIRADQEVSGGIIHKPMFERLILCPFAVADLTTANANVYYELGVRHAFKPFSTVQIIAAGSRLPFDVQMLRTIPYTLGPDGVPDPGETAATSAAIAKFLQEARKGAKDSPIFQLIDGLPVPNLEHLKTDVFRDQVEYSEQVKVKLADARRSVQQADAVRSMEKELGEVTDLDTGIAIDLMLSYRAVLAWEDMVNLIQRFSGPLAQTVMVREQLGLALNRLKRSDEAQRVLLKLIEERGPSSETCGILGRAYKDQWEDASKSGNTFLANGYLDKAIDMYLKGFQADWRDAYPGINAVTLMELRNPPDERRKELVPVVRYAVQRKMEKGKPDYWDYATLLELAVLEGNKDTAHQALGDALANVRERWEPETTARNVRLIRETRQARGEPTPFEADVEQALARAALLPQSLC
jgi:tetratricopeptide (TPR) repeat protein